MKAERSWRESREDGTPFSDSGGIDAPGAHIASLILSAFTTTMFDYLAMSLHRLPV